MRRQLIRVTKQHIRQGEPARGLSCALALALEDAGYEGPAVFGDEALTACGAALVLSWPARVFVARFDAKGKRAVKPAAFFLKVRQETRAVREAAAPATLRALP